MKKLIIPLLILIVLVVGWYFISPLFIDKEVDEAFPVVQEENQAFTGFDGIPTPKVFETLSESEQQALIQRMAQQGSELPDKTMTEGMPSNDPIALSSGSFKDADAFHKGSGIATLYKVGEKHFIRFEDFSVTNGPDLHVILSSHGNPTNQDEVKGGEYIDLGKLKGNRGSQNYELPAGVDPAVFKSVVIYCMPFHVVFSTASLE